MRNGLEIDKYGNKRWFLNDKIHRVNKPAIEYSSGTKCWYLNNKLHRSDGPAVEFKDGDKEWILDGVNLTEEEYLQVTRKNKLTELLYI